MRNFRCTACGRRVHSATVLGAGDCPHCGGDVVYDLREEHPEPRRDEARGLRGLLRRLAGR